MDNNPVVSKPIEDLVVAQDDVSTSFNLFENFDDPLTTGKVAKFELFDKSLGGGETNVLLFDQDAPETVENFSNYATDGDYVNSIIHRSIPDFIVQGGGFTVDKLAIAEVPADAPVVNEFSEDRSNLRGTIAMAKLGNDPNSATNQWFFNLGDNSANLDQQNGGFTVFGEVLSDNDLAVVDAIADLPTANVSTANPAFTDLPIITEDTENLGVESDENLVRYSNISVEQRDELEFEVLSNSNPELVNVSINQGDLTLDYQEEQEGTAEITIKATDLLGDSVEDTFTVTVGEESNPAQDARGLGVYRLLNNTTSTHLYTTDENERDTVLANLPNYSSEGESYVSVDSLTGDPEPQKVYRFYNQNTATHLYTISETEKKFIEDNLPTFSSEGESFSAYAEQQPGTIPVYRFLRPDLGSHFYTPSASERDFVEDNLPNYQSEGIAYYAFPIEE